MRWTSGRWLLNAVDYCRLWMEGAILDLAGYAGAEATQRSGDQHDYVDRGDDGRVFTC